MRMSVIANDKNYKSDVKILAVDDRDDNLLSIETILEKGGYNIIKANSGRAACADARYERL
jgi:PleD family two-component response regulator